MPYSVKIDGKVYNTDDLTLDECIEVEKYVRRLDPEAPRTWGSLMPLRSAVDCKAVMRVFLLRERTPAEADAFLSTLTAGKAVDAVDKVEDDLPDEYEDGLPKAEGEPETTTS